MLHKRHLREKDLRLYKDSIPEIMKAYNGEVEFQGLSDSCLPVEQAS